MEDWSRLEQRLHIQHRSRDVLSQATEKDPIAFFAFISFFPQLVAGPIERAANLLPQFLKTRQFDYPLAVEGCRQMLWGFLAKCVIADQFAMVTNAIFCQNNAGAGTLLVGALAFSFTVGCSDLAKKQRFSDRNRRLTECARKLKNRLKNINNQKKKGNK